MGNGDGNWLVGLTFCEQVRARRGASGAVRRRCAATWGCGVQEGGPVASSGLRGIRWGRISRPGPRFESALLRVGVAEGRSPRGLQSWSRAGLAVPEGTPDLQEKQTPEEAEAWLLERQPAMCNVPLIVPGTVATAMVTVRVIIYPPTVREALQSRYCLTDGVASVGH
uniref:Uncharacterized protein n=1 Tax=Myotis myotis TaxID=51298 RepID=A0A7J8AML2_MYOMY|nr:hypothetical protein mMyoMyo1_008218 [Myotis myotis]